MVRPSDPPAIIEFGRFGILPHRRQLLADRRPIRLGGRAFDLLLALIGAPGAVVGKDELLSRIWPGRIVEENRLQSEIWALRKALGADRDLIQTVAGRGYQFTGEIHELGAGVSARQVAAPLAVPASPSPATHPSENVSEPIGREATLSEVADHVSPDRRVTLIVTRDRQEPLGVKSRDSRRRNLPTGCGSRSMRQPNVGKSPPCHAERFAWRRASTGSVSRNCWKQSAPFSTALSEIVGRHSGFVASRLGNSVLVLFGYPAAHEHDAERAIHAGLELCGAVRTLSPDADVPMRCRVGIATGMVIVGDLVGAGEVPDHGIVGDTPDLAVRLQSSAQPDTVTIEPTTWRLIGNLFDCRDLGALDTNGDAKPIRRWLVLGESVVASRFEALRGSKLTPLVGRDEEIDLLLRRWARAKAGDGQIVLVSGEAGVGKSRITAELEERLHTEPHLCLRYFCSPYHQDSALLPIIDQLGRAAGFALDDRPVSKLEKLEVLLARAAPLDEDVAFLADLISLPASERHPLPNLSPQRKKERTLEALIRQLEGLAHEKPVVTVWEDAHWLDPTSRELLDLTVEHVRNLPVLLIVTFRPELHPPWAGQPQVSMLALSRLDRRDCTALITQVAGGKTLPDEVVFAIADRTDGVPLFVEELTKSVLERGLLREENDRYVLDRPLQPLAIPATLHASLLARLDRLVSARGVAQIGAAIGRQFSYALLRAVSRLPEDELQTALGQLVASELVFQRGHRPTRSTASSTRWCRTRLTAACCARPGSSCMRRSPTRSRPIPPRS